MWLKSHLICLYSAYLHRKCHVAQARRPVGQVHEHTAQTRLTPAPPTQRGARESRTA